MRFNVEFLGQNLVPYFKPELTAYIQIFKEAQPLAWSYELPPAFDMDPFDELEVTVDIQQIASFATLSLNSTYSIVIADLSSEQMTPGNYKVEVQLTDSHIVVTSYITIVVIQLPEPEPPAIEVEEVAPQVKYSVPMIEEQEVEETKFEFNF